jgi:hypothetical protein
LFDKPQRKGQVEIDPAFNFVQAIRNLRKKKRFVNCHEIALNIYLQHKRISGVISRAGAEEMLNTSYAEMCALSNPATVCVVNKKFVEKGVNIVVNEMMYDPVAEIGGEYLAFNRLVYNEADTRFDLIAVFENVIGKLKNVVLEVFFERQSVDGVALVTPGIEICLE